MILSDMFVSTNDTATHRVCGTCGELKPVTDFYRDGKDKDGNPRYRRDCKECYKITRMHEAAAKIRRSKR